MTTVSDAIVANGDRLGVVQAVVLMDIAVGVPSVYEVDQHPATGSFLMTLDSRRLRIVNSASGEYSPDAPPDQLWTFENGKWRLFDVRSKTLTLSDSYGIGQGPVDPRMAFLQKADDSTLDEFPALYTAVATGVDDVDSSLRWWDVESKAFGPDNRLRIWCDSNRGGLPVKSQVDYPGDGSHITTVLAELKYRTVASRQALLIDTATLYYYNPRPINESLRKENWNLKTTMTLTDVRLLDDVESRIAFRPESDLGAIERVRDLSTAARQQKATHAPIQDGPPLRPDDSSRTNWLLWGNVAVLLALGAYAGYRCCARSA